MKGRRISKEEVERQAWLARIELSEGEKDLFTEQFNDILGFFEKIDEAFTEGVEPTHHVLDLVNVFREDEVSPSLPAGESLKNAPKRERRFLKAPRIV